MKKLILVDCDGVLCDWESAFDGWMTEQGYNIQPDGANKYRIDQRYGIDGVDCIRLVKIFNQSAAIGFLPPLRDAIHYVKKLHAEHGYVFHCITSLSSNKNAQKLRHANLTNLFGPTVFEDIICLETGADKDTALLPYQNSGLFWIEDKLENAVVGDKMGLKSILVKHPFNSEYTGPIPLVDNWSSIYSIITGCTA
jgi:hypothetical protein